MSTFTVPRSEKRKASEIYSAMNRIQSETTPRLIISEHESIELNQTLAHILREIVENFSKGQAVTVIAHETKMTTQEAADFIGVSRPTLIKMLDEYAVPFENVGRHRKVSFHDIQQLSSKLRENRMSNLRSLRTISQELDEYEGTLENPLIS